MLKDKFPGSKFSLYECVFMPVCVCACVCLLMCVCQYIFSASKIKLQPYANVSYICFSFFFSFILFLNFTILCWFCQISK